MSIDWNAFTPWSALTGGLVIGVATALYLLGSGRVAGIAGIVASPMMAPPNNALQGVKAVQLIDTLSPWFEWLPACHRRSRTAHSRRRAGGGRGCRLAFQACFHKHVII